MSRRLTSAGRRLLALVALTLAATMTATTAAFGLAVPTVSTPKVGLPAPPQVPSVPGVPVPLPQAPAVPAPKSPVHAAPAPGAAPVRPGSAPRSVADAVAANGVALAPNSRSTTGARGTTGGGNGAGGQAGTTPQRSPAARRGVRERRFRRSVRRLSGCIDALPGLERRVLVLRAGLEGRRPHSRGFAAKRLGISLRRTAAAEHSGLRRLRRADRSAGCARSGGSPPAAGRAGAAVVALSGTPVLAGLLGRSAPPAAPGRTANGQRQPMGAVDGASASSPHVAGTAPAVRPAGEGGLSPLPPLMLAFLLAATLAVAALRPGWRLANGALAGRAERSTDRRQAELVAAVHGILGQRDSR